MVHFLPDIFIQTFYPVSEFLINKHYSLRKAFRLTIMSLHSSLWNVAPFGRVKKCYIFKTATTLSFDHISGI